MSFISQKLIGLNRVKESWDLSTASYSNVSFSVAAQDLTPTGLFFKPNGAAMYVSGNTGDDINQYSLSTPWDVSTASFIQTFSVAAQDTAPREIYFRPDGLRMYFIGASSNDIFQYTLSTAWDISTASYNQAFSATTAETGSRGLFFKPDGTQMYFCGVILDQITQYTLGTAWDISTASFVQSFNVGANSLNPTGIFFKYDGRKVFFSSVTAQAVTEFSLSVPWDVSSSSYSQAFSVASQETTPNSVFFRADGNRMFVIGNVADAVLAYNL